MTARTLNGWLVRDYPGPGTFVAPNGKTVYLADDDVAEVFRYIVEQWHARIEPLPKATHNTYPNERKGYIVVHGHRPKPVNGLANSNHLSGTAIDVLGDRHHYERSCTMANGNSCWGDGKPHAYISGFSSAQRAELRAIAAEVAQAAGKPIIRLGIDFDPGWRDAMHVELAPGTTNADVATAAAALRAARIVTDLTHIHTMLLALGYTADEAGVRTYQHDRGLVVDGIPGIVTQAALEADMATLASVEAKLDALSTVTLTDSQMAALSTGQRDWEVTRLLALYGHRLGWMFQRTANTRDAVNEMRAALPGVVVDAVTGALGDLPGVDPEVIRSKVVEAIESVTVTLAVPEED